MTTIKQMRDIQRKYKGTWSNKNRCIAYVYIFSLGSDLYKIGYSKNVHRRFEDLTAANPFARIIYSSKVGHAKREEDALHKMFVDKWVKREVFKLSLDDIERAKNYLISKRFP